MCAHILATKHPPTNTTPRGARRLMHTRVYYSTRTNDVAYAHVVHSYAVVIQYMHALISTRAKVCSRAGDLSLRPMVNLADTTPTRLRYKNGLASTEVGDHSVSVRVQNLVRMGVPAYMHCRHSVCQYCTNAMEPSRSISVVRIRAHNHMRGCVSSDR